jgi:hypothetical protein
VQGQIDRPNIDAGKIRPGSRQDKSGALILRAGMLKIMLRES